MKKILIISTGGTFNKIYDPIKGEFTVDSESHALENIASKWLCEFKIINIIGKDSLDMTNHDRLELLATISHSEYHHILIIHGTDTMDVTAEYLEDADLEKCIVLTGAMVPYSVDPVEATANLCSAYGYINALDKEGIFIAMNGVMGTYDKVKKDRTKGRFSL
ncbi:MAG: asparaginase [Sulfurovum sp.]|uniref:asparaginase domain-containing protein n=1 Tax=Sulfurovum sp. TaxID=1969726 RepID=UPI0028683A7C|nr:asparaginase domain-containing protein [Sulfurovum sp.]MCO4845362.1 asparaginase [Sulfurovum sp.]